MPRKPANISSVRKYTTAPKASDKTVKPSISAPAATVTAAPAEELKTPAVSCNTVKVEPTVSVQALIQSLRDPSADVARDAAVELGGAKDASAVAPLIEVITNDDGYYHDVVRAAAAEALGRLGDVRAVEPLLTLSRDTMAEAIAEAVRAWRC